VGGGTLADLDTRADGNGGKGGNDTPQVRYTQAQEQQM